MLDRYDHPTEYAFFGPLPEPGACLFVGGQGCVPSVDETSQYPIKTWRWFQTCSTSHLDDGSVLNWSKASISPDIQCKKNEERIFVSDTFCDNGGGWLMGHFGSSIHHLIWMSHPPSPKSGGVEVEKSAKHRRMQRWQRPKDWRLTSAAPLEKSDWLWAGWWHHMCPGFYWKLLLRANLGKNPETEKGADGWMEICMTQTSQFHAVAW